MCIRDRFQAFALQYAKLSSLAWTTTIAYATYQNCVNEVRLEDIRRGLYTYHALCNVLPLILSLAPFYFHAYGYDTVNHVCWLRIRELHPQTFFYLGLGFFYVPLVIALFFLLISYRLVIRETCKRLTDQKQAEFTKKLISYQVPLFICFVPEAVYRAYFALYNVHLPWAAIMCVFCYNILGTLNATVYGGEVLALLGEESPFSYFCFCFKREASGHSEVAFDSDHNSDEQRSRYNSLSH
eukprot:TRINITY_DN12704_c0_g1_i2.p1 TRINITY_DN12704_c0_g1~~TRINITY_DN12704_c0_g1_i2.p1  ORF type:complete len:256 (-),score=42.90 TRINITY_DN12704_c0_g1_i2:111-830(-)